MDELERVIPMSLEGHIPGKGQDVPLSAVPSNNEPLRRFERKIYVSFDRHILTGQDVQS